MHPMLKLAPELPSPAADDVAEGTPRGRSPEAFSVSDTVEAWYFVGPSDELTRGGTKRWSLGSRAIVLYRGTDDGVVRAVDAHCPHMGASLAHGRVEGRKITCPLHSWQFGPGGDCEAIAGKRVEGCGAKVGTWPVAEVKGGIFVFNGREARFAPPTLSRFDIDDFVWRAIEPIEARAAWEPVVANAFDIEHLETVHNRALLEPPKLYQPDHHRMVFEYVSRVVGTQASDRLVKYLSKDRLDISITCYGGPITVVETRLAKSRSAAILSTRWSPNGCSTSGLIGVSKGGLLPANLRARIACWMYSSFLKKDVLPMEDMQFQPHSPYVRCKGIKAITEFLAARPKAEVRVERSSLPVLSA